MQVLLIAGWFASPLIKSVVEKAQNYVRANYELHKDTRKMVDTLTNTLALCQATVVAAERTMITDSNLATWLKDLKEAVYDAEDVLDYMEAKSIEQERAKNKVSKFIASSSQNVWYPGGKKLKSVLDKLSKLSDKIPTFLELLKMEKDESSNDGFTDERENSSQMLGKLDLCGRHEELNLILEMIFDPKSRSRLYSDSGSRDWLVRQNYNKYDGLLVIPIVGICGVGKTALAQAVFDHPEVQQNFEIQNVSQNIFNTTFPSKLASKAWISVAYNLDVNQLMRKLIQSLGGYLNLDMMSFKDIERKLSAIISEHKLLVVLDDVGEKIENEWESFNTLLSKSAPGSVLLITTQNEQFANKVGTFGHILMKPLEGEVFWELFKHFAFGNTDICELKKNRLEQIGKKIANKLHGLPSAAKIIGDILRSKIDIEEWNKISKMEWWQIPNDKSKILAYIGVGYKRLDPFLRQCFAYCSLFPKNTPIEKEKLIQMWIAQNFIPPDCNGQREMEDTAGEWFDKLVQMSFFIPSPDYNKCYVMPSLMHDLAVIVSSDECFYLTDDQSHTIPQSVRHLAVNTENLEVLKRIRKYKKLRSFLYFGKRDVNRNYSSCINDILCKLHRVRVLDLSYLHMRTKEPPKAIQNMTHLRFLNLSSTGIEVLTHSEGIIKRFKHSKFDHFHLQALHIQECTLLKLPRSLNKLTKMRHLNANADTIALISGIGQLVDLQELNEYRVGKEEGHKITELKNLAKIKGHLTVNNCANINNKEEAKQAKLVGKEYLNSIKISWNSAPREGEIDMEILEGLKPYEDIKELTIEGYMGSLLPGWMREMSHFWNLRTIRLVKCHYIEVLPPLGQLQFLSTLEIMNNIALREAPLDSFPISLKVLKIVGCHNLNSLDRSLPHLISLSQLYISNFTVPIELDINRLTLLEDLVLMHCPELRVQIDLRSHTNLNKLKINDCPMSVIA